MNHRMGIFVSLAMCAALGADLPAGQARLPNPVSQAKQAAPAPPVSVTTPLTTAQMTGKQAVIETTAGRIVIALLPAQAPNHVGYVIKLAQEGAYNGTTFHRLIRHGIIQGGDPLSKDPAKTGQYGTGGLKMLAFEPGAGAHVRGAVSSVLVPGNRDSAGSQFFICVTPQAALDGQYTVFGRVVDGMRVVDAIEKVPREGEAPTTRIDLVRVRIERK